MFFVSKGRRGAEEGEGAEDGCERRRIVVVDVEEERRCSRHRAGAVLKTQVEVLGFARTL